MFLKNPWYVAAWDTEVVKDKPLARQILGEDVVLYRGADRKAVAMVDRCCHRLAPSSMGRIEGSNLRSMYHGLLFVPDGRCVEMPQDKSVPRAPQSFQAAGSGAAARGGSSSVQETGVAPARRAIEPGLAGLVVCWRRSSKSLLSG